MATKFKPYLNQIMKLALLANQQARQEPPKPKAGAKIDLDYGDRYCVVRINAGRMTGKTTWIESFVKAKGIKNVVVLTFTADQADHFNQKGIRANTIMEAMNKKFKLPAPAPEYFVLEDASLMQDYGTDEVITKFFTKYSQTFIELG